METIMKMGNVFSILSFILLLNAISTTLNTKASELKKCERFRKVKSFNLGKNYRNLIEISENSHFAALLGLDGNKIRIYNIREQKTVLTHKKFTCVTFSPNSNFVAIGLSDKQIKIYNLKKKNGGEKNGKKKKEKVLSYLHDKIKFVSFSKDSNFVISYSENNIIKVYDLKKEKIVCSHTTCDSTNTNSVTSIEFANNNKENFLIYGSENGKVTIYDIEKKETAFSYTHSGSVHEICVTHSNDKNDKNVILSFAVTGQVKLCDIGTKKVELLKQDDTGISCFAHTKNKSFVGLGSISNDVIIYDIEKKEKNKQIFSYSHPSIVMKICFSKNMNIVASGCLADEVKVYNFITKELLCSYKASDCICSLLLSLDGNFVISSSDDGEVIVYDVKKKKEVCKYNNGNKFLSTCARYLLGSNVKKLWDIIRNPTDTYYRICNLHEITNLFVSKDHKYVISISKDGRVIIHETSENFYLPLRRYENNKKYKKIIKKDIRDRTLFLHAACEKNNKSKESILSNVFEIKSKNNKLKISKSLICFH